MSHRTLPLLLTALLPLLMAADVREIAYRQGANLQRPTWSLDARTLAYEANFHDEKRIELYVGPFDGTRFTRIVPTVRSSSSLTAGFSKVSAAGEVAHELSFAPPSIGRFVYTASNDVQDYELYIGGGGAITTSPGADGGAQWSPDGRFIVFTSARSGEGDLYLLDTLTIEAPPRQLTNTPDSSELYVTWSPDSTKLAFVGRSKQGDNLWLIPGLGDPAVRLTDWTGSQTRPTFAPNGRWIAFYANLEVTDRTDLYVVEPREHAAPRLVQRGVVPNAAGPAWTPDGGSMVVVIDDDKRFDPIALVEPRNGSGPLVLDLGTVGNGDLDVVKTPEGRMRIAWVAQGRTGDTVRDFKRLYVTELPLPSPR